MFPSPRPLGFPLEPSYNLVVQDPYTGCIQVLHTFISDISTFPWVLEQPRTPRIFINWFPSSNFFFPRDPSSHGYCFILPPPRKEPPRSLVQDTHHLRLVCRKTVSTKFTSPLLKGLGLAEILMGLPFNLPFTH